jgi:phosphate starvation-inducible PhoH-like protein
MDSCVNDSRTIVVEDAGTMSALVGAGDLVLKELERAMPNVEFLVRGNMVSLQGDADGVNRAAAAIEDLLDVVRSGVPLTAETARESLRMLARDASVKPVSVLSRSILSTRGRTIRPKTQGQAAYVQAIDSHTVTFGIGPAGTGKTYLAMAQAVAALQAKRVNRIVLTRPAVEAGERLGFLPGSLSEKIDPYLRPLYDALHDMMDPEAIPKFLEAGTIEVAPLAYMRGRTLNEAFVILDEAQNTTREQMKMFLTRLGFGTTMVVTGDITQVDLPGTTQSGLRAARDILLGVEDIAFCELTAQDVVRHRLVSDIITAYAKADEGREAPDGQRRRLSPRHTTPDPTTDGGWRD